MHHGFMTWISVSKAWRIFREVMMARSRAAGNWANLRAEMNRHTLVAWKHLNLTAGPQLTVHSISIFCSDELITYPSMSMRQLAGRIPHEYGTVQGWKWCSTPSLQCGVPERLLLSLDRTTKHRPLRQITLWMPTWVKIASKITQYSVNLFPFGGDFEQNHPFSEYYTPGIRRMVFAEGFTQHAQAFMFCIECVVLDTVFRLHRIADTLVMGWGISLAVLTRTAKTVYRVGRAANHEWHSLVPCRSKVVNLIRCSRAPDKNEYFDIIIPPERDYLQILAYSKPDRDPSSWETLPGSVEANSP
ncbi:hypothetical protein BKA93DRAFT_753434 [Sparassis latifolia]